MASTWISLKTEKVREMVQSLSGSYMFAEKSHVPSIHISLDKTRDMGKPNVSGMKRKILPERGHHR